MEKEITVYELIGLIKDGKAPKEIDYLGDKYVFNKDMQTYRLFDDYNWQFILGQKVTILDDEKEWYDMEEISYIERGNLDKDTLLDLIISNLNKFIKNQKYLKEMIEEE